MQVVSDVTNDKNVAQVTSQLRFLSQIWVKSLGIRARKLQIQPEF